MTSRWLKEDDGKFVNGKNDKKLRYLFYKKTGQVQTTFDANWTDNSINRLTEMFPDKVERVQAKRGRPKKSLSEKKEKRKVKRKKEKRLEQTAATVDTSDEDNSFDIDGYELVEEGSESYYKNSKDWLFNLEGDYIGHYNNNGRFLKR